MRWYDHPYFARGALMIGYCELCRRLGDLNECSACGRSVCGSCTRAAGGKRYCIACAKKIERDSPETAKKKGDWIAVLLLFFMMASLAIMYPKYQEIEKKRAYMDFSGIVPVEHNRTSGGLVILFENQFNQPVSLTSVSAGGNCTFGEKRVSPNERFIVSCVNRSATLIRLEYYAGDISLRASGRIPPASGPN